MTGSRKLPLDGEGAAAKKLRAALVPAPRFVTIATDIPGFYDDLQPIVYDSAVEVDVTAPSAARSPTLEPGWQVELVNIGAGAVVVAVEAGDVLISAGSLSSISQGNAAQLMLLSEAAGVRTYFLCGGLS